MKPAIIVRSAGLTMLTLLIFASAGYAFHEGGEGFCDGCHGKWKGEKMKDPSSICLDCHSREYQVLSADGSAYTPGGDFFWLGRDYGTESAGYTHGHNVVARKYGLQADPERSLAPSYGSVVFPSSELGCTSCHDPHATTGEGGDAHFRLLGGEGYVSPGASVKVVFEKAAPVARSYSGQAGRWPEESDDNHTDYGSGMSEWCTNCHAGYTTDSHLHPAGETAQLGSLASFYNRYVATGDFTGTFSRGYDFLVPIERNVTDPSLLSPQSREGAGSNSQVMCLTCHRAHASAFSAAGRWDFSATFLSESEVLSSPEGVHAYNGEDIATRYGQYQRSLCNKCHARD